MADRMSSTISLMIPELTAEQKAAYLGVNVQAHVDVPLLINGKFVALLSAEQSTPRQWKEEEIALIVETAERTSASVERAQRREGPARREARSANPSKA